MIGDRWLRLEFAVLLTISLLALWQMARFIWRTLAALV